ncbi:MAG TPA: GAF domain-containing protein [Terriglobales bacterium]|nr:GAF domain-containing protein [Terriglobales bacterium]
MHQSAQPENLFPGAEDGIAGRSAAGDNSNGNPVLRETELDSALQLLVERAQYITGATGTALALPQGEEMVCRASAGASAPAVGARLQVRSGLTGESISRRQLLRCDNAEVDGRVNLEACRALGIASIVVLPLLRRDGAVRGLFELFSDHPYAFEERDLVALQRMADLTLTALDLAEQRRKSAPAPRLEAEKAAGSSVAGGAVQASAIPLDAPLNNPPEIPPNPESISPSAAPAPAPVPATGPGPELVVPEAMLRVQKCASCGFPVSEGRTFCLDCERKDVAKRNSAEKERKKKEESEIMQKELEGGVLSTSEAPVHEEEEFVPAFLANTTPAQESWLANHVNLLAIVVLILGILVAVVVFR